MNNQMQPKKFAGTLLVSVLLSSSALAAPQTKALEQAQDVLNSIHLSNDSAEETAAKLRAINDLLKRAKLEQNMRTGSDTEWMR